MGKKTKAIPDLEWFFYSRNIFQSVVKTGQNAA